MTSRWPTLFVATVSALFLLACTDLLGGTPTEPAAKPCCDVEGIVQMTKSGVAPEVIIDAIRTSGTDLDLSADQIITMSSAGVDRTVIDVLNGGPCVCAEPEPVATVVAATKPAAEKEPALNLTVNYKGGNDFELINLSTRDYTGLMLIANGEYQYRLKKLPPGADNIRFANFTSRTNGEELPRKPGLKKLVVTADQGRYSKTFE